MSIKEWKRLVHPHHIYLNVPQLTLITVCHTEKISSDIFLYWNLLAEQKIFILKATETFVYHLIGNSDRLTVKIFLLMTCLIGLNSLCSPAFTFSINNSIVPSWNVFYNCVITHLIYPIVKPRVWLNINNCLVLLVSLVGKQTCNLR